MKKIGFTGTAQGAGKFSDRGGMCPAQYRAVSDVFKGFVGEVEFHHGDCVGADAQANRLVRTFRWKTVSHPPENEYKRAYTANDETRPVKPYLHRNHDIVDETEILVAAPGTLVEILKSGTWATIRYARKLGRPVIIVYPDGRVEQERL